MGEEMPLPQWPFERVCPLDPPPTFAELRNQGPMTRIGLWDGSCAWMATDYESVRTLLADRHVSSDITREGFPQYSPNAMAQRGQQRSFVRMDPPKHDEHRLMLTADFMVRRVRKLGPYLEHLIERSFDEMERGGRPADLVSALAQPIPANVITRLLDLPSGDSTFFQDRVNTWMSLDSEPEASARAAADAVEYFADLIAARMDSSADDLVSRLIRDHVHTGDLTTEELQHMLHLLLVGGFDTTANMISLGTLTFLQHPDQLEQLRQDPSLVKGAVEELLRYLSVAHHVAFRQATDTIEVGETTVHAGDGVVAPIIAANHDPVVFADPERFDIHRDARGHLAFGFGVHQCLGQALARVELQAVFARLFRRFPKLHLAVEVDDLRFKNALIYGVEELPVSW